MHSERHKFSQLLIGHPGSWAIAWTKGWRTQSSQIHHGLSYHWCGFINRWTFSRCDTNWQGGLVCHATKMLWCTPFSTLYHSKKKKKLTSSNPLKLFIICMWPPMFPSPLVKFYEPTIKGWTVHKILFFFFSFISLLLVLLSSPNFQQHHSTAGDLNLLAFEDSNMGLCLKHKHGQMANPCQWPPYGKKNT